MNCSYCGTTATVEYVCSGCFEAQYCSEACGNAHWDDGKHASKCLGDELIGKKEKWIQKAIKKPGSFSKQAKRAHMSTTGFANKVMHDKSHRYSETTHHRAALAKTLSKFHK
jgi:hypothetical protein